MKAGALTQASEPNALPHEVHCVCCPRRVSILTRTYISPQGTVEYWQTARPIRSFSASDDSVFIRGLLLEVTVAQGRAWLNKYEPQTETTPHDRQAYRLPPFALAVGKVVWVCPTCEQILKGHLFNVEQYLAERQRIFGHLEPGRFKLSNSSSA